MAQQVAHEIKNPLTPMRLGAQHLERAWADGAEDFAERLKRYTKTTVQQIDALSHIAEGFALLATDGAVEPQQVELGALLEDVTGLHAERKVRWLRQEEKEAWVWPTKPALSGRSTTDSKRPGVQVRRRSGRGSGIARSRRMGLRDRVGQRRRHSRRTPDADFEPKFTTKTHGLGLGLAMVRAIVQGAKGEVTVQSKEGEGTEFEVRLPRVTPRGEAQVG